MELSWGSCQVPEHWQPTDSLALHFQDARIHANTLIHVALSAALWLPWQQTPLSNIGVAHCARESGTNLSCTAKGASVKAHGDKQYGTHGPSKTCGLFLSSARLPTKWLVSLTSSRKRNSWRRRKQLIFLLLPAMVWTTNIIIARTVANTEATKAIVMNANTTVATTIIDATITLVTTRKTSRKNPARIEMIANVIISKKKEDVMHNDHSSSFSSDTSSRKISCSRQGLLLDLALVYANPQVTNHNHKQSSSLKCKYSYSGNEEDEVHHPENVIASLPPLPPQKGRKGMVPCRELRQQSNRFVSHLAYLFQIWNLFFWLIVTLH